MSDIDRHLLTLFAAALDCPSGPERAALLDRECGQDPARRAEVEALLRAHDQVGRFLEPPAEQAAATLALADPAVATLHHSPDPAAGTVVAGRYTLMEVIGEGGMGTVWRAEQQEPVRRQVALKLIKPGMDSRQVVARFEAEQQALALMDHPNIAKVLDGGATADGRPFFVMELVAGVPVSAYCDAHKLTVRQRLELFVPVCQAIQHAHQKGVIHRDIKPTNVLVAVYDGVPVPKVIDFGIAKAVGQPLTDKTLFTGFAQLVGTPLYMSPEQVELSGLDVDTRTDVYALGVLLYELLTGTTPFDQDRLRTVAFDELRRIISEEEPARPSTRMSTLGLAADTASVNRRSDAGRLSRLLRGELDWIVMKALEKDRNRRYESAAAFAVDVARYLADEPVLACPPSAGYRCRKFARRNQPALVTAMAAALAVVTAVTGLAASTFLITREQRETAKALHDANVAKDDLKQINDRERVDGYFRRISLAHAALSANDLGGALKLLGECPEDLRQWEWRYLMRLCRVEPVVIRDGKAVHSIAFSPDGECLTSAGGDGAVRVWNSRTGQLISAVENAHRGFACSVAFHPDGHHVASVGADRLVKVWDLTTGRAVFERPCDAVHPFGTAYAVAFSPLAPDHLVVGNDGTVTIWDWRAKKPVHTFPGHETDRISLAFSPDGRRLATGNWKGTVKLWDAVAGDGPLHTFIQAGGVRHPAAALAFGPDGTRLATASYNRRVDVWDTTTGRLLHTLPHRGGLVVGVAFGRDGRLASVGEDTIVRVWDATGRELLGLRGHTGMCGCAAFSPDGLRLASAGLDGTIRLWDATPLRGDERQESASFEEHSDEVWSVAVSPDGRRVVSAGWSMPIVVWDAETRRVSGRFNGHGVIVFCVAWHPDGRRIASAGWDGRQFAVKVWDVTTGEAIFTLPAPGRPEFFAVTFSPDGRYLVTGRGNGAVQVWDANDGRPIRPLGTHHSPIRGVVFSPDRRHLATANADGEIKLWDATRLGTKQESQQPLRTIHAHPPGQSVNVAFSPDGTRLVMSDKGDTVKICDVETGQELLVLRGHTGDVYTVATSPDGRWVASAGEDSTVKVWSARTGKIVRTFRGHTGLVSSLAFIDERTLISGSRDHTVKLWDVSKLKEDPGH